MKLQFKFTTWFDSSDPADRQWQARIDSHGYQADDGTEYIYAGDPHELVRKVMAAIRDLLVSEAQAQSESLGETQQQVRLLSGLLTNLHYATAKE